MRHSLRLAAILCLALTVPVNVAHAVWQPAQIKDGGVARDAQKQAFSMPGGTVRPYGLVQMQNGTPDGLVAMVVSASTANGEHPYITLSNDAGNTWSAPQSLPPSNSYGWQFRPQMLTYLGGQSLSYVADGKRYVSGNYGQSWGTGVDVPMTPIIGTGAKYPFEMEGNAGVDRDAAGNVTQVMEIGYGFGAADVPNPYTARFRAYSYSSVGGYSLQNEVQPPNWHYTSIYNGTPYQRGVSEGSVVRAANGDLVAALRIDMPARMYKGSLYDDRLGCNGYFDDSLEGTAVSISKDNGAHWSDMNMLFESGRHHANLQSLPNGDLLMTLIVREDIRTPGASRLDSTMRGCDALISHNNGLTWNLDQRITLDEFEYLDTNNWVHTQCGHLGTTVLADGSVLTSYGNYLNGTATLIKWNPTHCPEPGTCVLAVMAVGWVGVASLCRRHRRKS
jgi:hypothetical protein